jgi:hypothetical protein
VASCQAVAEEVQLLSHQAPPGRRVPRYPASVTNSDSMAVVIA